MGLDTTHDCWHGPYSSFGQFRKRLAGMIGMNLGAMEGFGGSIKWELLAPDPLHVLLNHSDCEGDISVEDCLPLAKRLEQLAEAMTEDVNPYGDKFLAERFAKGLRAAHEANEKVEFH